MWLTGNLGFQSTASGEFGYPERDATLHQQSLTQQIQCKYNIIFVNNISFANKGEKYLGMKYTFGIPPTLSQDWIAGHNL